MERGCRVPCSLLQTSRVVQDRTAVLPFSHRVWFREVNVVDDEHLPPKVGVCTSIGTPAA